MTQKWIEQGSPTAKLWLVGEAPGENEVARGIPFIGASGAILDGCLHEAGIERRDCYLTNVCHERPPSYVNAKGATIHNDIEQFFATARDAKRDGIPLINNRYPLGPVRAGLDRLNRQIEEYAPSVIVALGGTPLWGTAGQSGITKWRGSVFQVDPATAIVAAPHPADCLPNRSPQHRPLLVHDLGRAKRVLMDRSLAEPPKWNFWVADNVAQLRGELQDLHPENPITCDIETWLGQIHCLGIGMSDRGATCIPFIRADGTSWWSLEDELEIILLLRDFLTSREVTFHNGIYDCQYIAKQWGFMPRHEHDTMVMQHVAFPGFLGGKIDPVTGRVDKRGSSLSLSFVASLYCRNYRFWKDDGRLWDPTLHDEQRYFHYNCEDCCRTWEVAAALRRILVRDKLWDQYRFVMRTLQPVYKMMFAGFNVDAEKMRGMYAECEAEMDRDQRWLSAATGIEGFNPESNPQMKALFYKDLQQQPIYKGKGPEKTQTCDDDALDKIARRTPLLRPLTERIQHYRSMETVRKDCNTKMLSADGRLRGTMNPAYVETFRFSSNETAFGEGTNLQNFKRPE